MECEELLKVREQLLGVLDKSFAKECMTNYDLLNPVVAANIDFKTPEKGEVILKLVTLAKERNIDYTPSMESQTTLMAYCLRKEINPPEGVCIDSAPAYVPVPQPMNIDVAPPAGGMVGYGGGAPVYQQ